MQVHWVTAFNGISMNYFCCTSQITSLLLWVWLFSMTLCSNHCHSRDFFPRRPWLALGIIGPKRENSLSSYLAALTHWCQVIMRRSSVGQKLRVIIFVRRFSPRCSRSFVKLVPASCCCCSCCCCFCCCFCCCHCCCCCRCWARTKIKQIIFLSTEDLIEPTKMLFLSFSFSPLFIKSFHYIWFVANFNEKTAKVVLLTTALSCVPRKLASAKLTQGIRTLKLLEYLLWSFRRCLKLFLVRIRQKISTLWCTTMKKHFCVRLMAPRLFEGQRVWLQWKMIAVGQTIEKVIFLWCSLSLVHGELQTSMTFSQASKVFLSTHEGKESNPGPHYLCPRGYLRPSSLSGYKNYMHGGPFVVTIISNTNKSDVKPVFFIFMKLLRPSYSNKIALTRTTSSFTRRLCSTARTNLPEPTPGPTRQAGF